MKQSDGVKCRRCQIESPCSVARPGCAPKLSQSTKWFNRRTLAISFSPGILIANRCNLMCAPGGLRMSFARKASLNGPSSRDVIFLAHADPARGFRRLRRGDVMGTRQRDGFQNIG